MFTIIRNTDNLKEAEITEVVKRVKVLLFNTYDEIVLGYSYHEYQFIGGHVEENEDLKIAVKRELKEEIGLDFDTSNLEPFACNISYYKDYPTVGNNQKIEIYYYEIKTDKLPVLNNTNYTDCEKDGNFEIRIVPLNKLEEELKNNMQEFGDPNGIASEMLGLLKFYKEQERKIEVGNKYRHFKGHEYTVIAIAKHSETEELMVVYQNNATGEVWVRAYDMFNSEVDHEKYPDVLQKYRFEQIE